MYFEFIMLYYLFEHFKFLAGQTYNPQNVIVLKSKVLYILKISSSYKYFKIA